MKNWEYTEEFLTKLPLPTKTNTYTPIPHSLFVETLQNRIENAGLAISSKKFLVNDKGKLLVGEYTIRTEWDEEGGDDQMTLCIGFFNSYNKVKAAGATSGAIVLKCLNGLYGSDHAAYFSKKHYGSTTIDMIIEGLDKVVAGAKTRFLELLQDRDTLKKQRLTQEIISHIIGELYITQSIISASQIVIIKHEMEHSAKFNDRTAWSLYNWITESYKSTHPVKYISDHLKLHAYFSDAFGLSTARGLYNNSLANLKLELEQPNYIGEVVKNYELMESDPDSFGEGLVDEQEEKEEKEGEELELKVEQEHIPDPSKYMSLEEALEAEEEDEEEDYEED
jgi:hypothetical protein